MELILLVGLHHVLQSGEYLTPLHMELSRKFVPRRRKLHLTLIGPGEVNVDLADFDLKLRENLLSNLIFKKYLFLQKRLPSLFELLT